MPSKKAAQPASPSFVLAEDAGLVTVVLSPTVASAQQRLPSRGCRVRLQPPKKALREDGHVFDLPAALAVVETSVIPGAVAAEPSAAWTDTVVGNGRVTVSFAASGAQAMRRLLAAAEGLVPKGWGLEEAILDGAAAARLRSLRARAALVPVPSAKERAVATSLEAALAGVESPGSFRKRAGLDKASLDARTVVKALGWLSSSLPVADGAIRKVLGASARDARLGVYVNAHPRMRTFVFELVADEQEDQVVLPSAVDAVLGRFFDAPAAEARRICGPLWDHEIFDLEKAPRVTLDASS